MQIVTYDSKHDERMDYFFKENRRWRRCGLKGQKRYGCKHSHRNTVDVIVRRLLLKKEKKEERKKAKRITVKQQVIKKYDVRRHKTYECKYKEECIIKNNRMPWK